MFFPSLSRLFRRGLPFAFPRFFTTPCPFSLR